MAFVARLGSRAPPRDAAGVSVSPLMMRDTDRDLTSVVVVRKDGPSSNVAI